MSGFLKRQHAQTMHLLHEAVDISTRANNIEASRANRRAEWAKEDLADEQQDSLIQTMNENMVLRGELARRDQELLEQKDLVAYWANGNESYRRTIQHLCQFWAPQDSPETPKQAKADQVNAIVQDKTNEVLNDPKWAETRNTHNEKRVSKRRQRHSNS